MITIFHGDSRLVLQGIPSETVDGVVSDAPYALVSISKRFGSATAAPANSMGASSVYRRASAGFMGQDWDTGETAHDPAFWAEVWRVLKPGGHIIVAAGTRTYHRLAVAIEDAGFEIRDMLTWLYGTGFPKSHNHDLGGEKWGTGLKPACEPWVLARKPLAGSVAENISRYGVGALNIDACRVGADEITVNGYRADTGQTWGANSGMLAASVARTPTSHVGRWPANVCTDGSEEVFSAFPQSRGQRGDLKATGRARPTKHALGDMAAPNPHLARGDTGSAARFFYSAKATSRDRCGSQHPTVKPIALMQWLCRMIIPAGGLVLDPFAGSGTTGAAAYREGFSAILIEREARFVTECYARMAFEQRSHQAPS